MLNSKDIKFEYMRGQGPGGQHKNKTSSCVRATHVPTGLSVIVDGRNQHKNKKEAIKKLEEKLKKVETNKLAKEKKEKRDELIHTYNYKRGTVKDHRTGKTASLKEILEDAKLDLLRGDI